MARWFSAQPSRTANANFEHSESGSWCCQYWLKFVAQQWSSDDVCGRSIGMALVYIYLDDSPATIRTDGTYLQSEFEQVHRTTRAADVMHWAWLVSDGGRFNYKFQIDSGVSKMLGGKSNSFPRTIILIIINDISNKTCCKCLSR